MRTNSDRSVFIKILDEVPFVSYAAKKSGIARATIYRWKKNNPEFREQLEMSLDSGRDQLIDVAEMALIEKIKSRDITAIKFFLQHNSERYRQVRNRKEDPQNKSDYEKYIDESLHGLSDEALDRQIRELEEDEDRMKNKNNDSKPD